MRNHKKYLILLALILITISVLGSATYADKTLSFQSMNAIITIDGRKVNFNNDMGYPVLTSTERTLVPLRIISENMGYKVDWSEDTWHQGLKKVWISNSEIKVELEIGKTTALVNGVKTPIDVQDGKPVNTKSILINDRTYVPLRFVTEALGGEIKYERKNDGTHIIDIITGKEQDIGEEIITGNIKFNPQTDVYEDGRMTEEKTLEYLDEILKNIKVYKENGKYYLKYDHVKVPDGFVVSIGLNTRFNNSNGRVGLALSTGTAFIPKNQLPKNQSFIKELDSSKMQDIMYCKLTLTVANPNSTDSANWTTSAKYSISYYLDRNEVVVTKWDKFQTPRKEKTLDKNLIFQGF